MDMIYYPPRDMWQQLCRRALVDKTVELEVRVAEIIKAVVCGGDEALFDFECRFTGAELDSLEVTKKELEEATRQISPELRDAIEIAYNNIEKFHSAQLMKAPVKVETSPGVYCEQRAVAIDRVGLYIPGGNSPLFSTVLMLAIPAKIAGCGEIILCTPARCDGTIHPGILYAASRVGVDRIFKVGGAQAIAAMAYGTDSIPRVYKIFGPGNRYVMEAKQQVTHHNVAIDMPAGPSEVLVIADETANPEFVAADFLSQAEHGPDSQSILLTTSQKLVDSLSDVIEDMLHRLPREEMMRKSLSHSHIILFEDDEEMIDFSNEYAPEHLIINHKDAEKLARKVRNAGSVFIGQYTPESAGDYASGTNHTLPTSGFARAYSGVNIDSFMKKITFQRISPEGVRSIGNAVEIMARNEELDAHALAMTLRINSVDSK